LVTHMQLPLLLLMLMVTKHQLLLQGMIKLLLSLLQDMDMLKLPKLLPTTMSSLELPQILLLDLQSWLLPSLLF
ncbi:hypothetical protein HDV02_001070, partial [Globomyces sp. JEL0801]